VKVTIRGAIGHRPTIEEILGASIELADTHTSFALHEIDRFAANCIRERDFNYCG
jgi:hypothetical protein